MKKVVILLVVMSLVAMMTGCSGKIEEPSHETIDKKETSSVLEEKTSDIVIDSGKSSNHEGDDETRLKAALHNEDGLYRVYISEKGYLLYEDKVKTLFYADENTFDYDAAHYEDFVEEIDGNMYLDVYAWLDHLGVDESDIEVDGSRIVISSPYNSLRIERSDFSQFYSARDRSYVFMPANNTAYIWFKEDGEPSSYGIADHDLAMLAMLVESYLNGDDNPW